MSLESMQSTEAPKFKVGQTWIGKLNLSYVWMLHVKRVTEGTVYYSAWNQYGHIAESVSYPRELLEPYLVNAVRLRSKSKRMCIINLWKRTPSPSK